jgi:hypothetical protein
MSLKVFIDFVLIDTRLTIKTNIYFKLKFTQY